MLRWFLVLAAFVGVVGGAAADNIGYFNDNTAANAGTAAAITAAGHTPVELSGLSAGDIAGLNVVWILNSDNGGYSTEVTNNVAVLEAFVAGGGVLSFHDRFVDGAGTVLPGAGGVNFVRDFSDDQNINVINNTTLVTNGPGGVIDDTTLDGGDSSSHGFAALASLPAGAIGVLSRTDPAEVVDFFYPFGGGYVYYSTMPLD